MSNENNIKQKFTVEQHSKGTVSVEHKDGKGSVSKSDVEEDLGAHSFAQPSALIIFRRGETVNKGDFSSARIDVGIHVPCDLEKADDAFELAQRWVTDRLATEVKNATQDTKKKYKYPPTPDF